MEPAARRKSVDQVMGNPDLVGEILQRAEFPSSKALIKNKKVRKSWSKAVKSKKVARRFAERNTAANIGFLVEIRMPHSVDSMVKLLYAHDSAEESADGLRGFINKEILALDTILASQNGYLLTKAPIDSTTSPSSTYYYTSCPCDAERVYKPAGTKITEIPREGEKYSVNTYGQFGLVRGDWGGGLSFFVRDPSGVFDINHNGVTFKSTDDLFIHVSTYADGGWNRVVSTPIASQGEATFHRNPYSYVVGTKIYMMYVIRFIVCHDFADESWTVIPLPSDDNWEARKWYEYIVAPDGHGGVLLLNYRSGKLKKWALTTNNDITSWTLVTSINLVEKFGKMINTCCWQRVFMCEHLEELPDIFYTIQVTQASDGGRFVILKLGFKDILYEVDMEVQSVREINSGVNSATFGMVYALSERWPPKP